MFHEQSESPPRKLSEPPSEALEQVWWTIVFTSAPYQNAADMSIFTSYFT